MARRNLTAEQSATLAAEITADPDRRDYAAMAGPEFVLADLQARRFPGESRHTVLTIAAALGRDVADRLARSMQAIARDGGLMAEILEVARSGEGVDVNHPDTRAMIAAMAADESAPLTIDDAKALAGLAANRRSWLDVNALPVPRLREIREAMEPTR